MGHAFRICYETRRIRLSTDQHIHFERDEECPKYDIQPAPEGYTIDHTVRGTRIMLEDWTFEYVMPRAEYEHRRIKAIAMLNDPTLQDARMTRVSLDHANWEDVFDWYSIRAASPLPNYDDVCLDYVPPIALNRFEELAKTIGASTKRLHIGHQTSQAEYDDSKLLVVDLPEIVRIVREYMPALRRLSIPLLCLTSGFIDPAGWNIAREGDVPISDAPWIGQLEEVTIHLQGGVHWLDPVRVPFFAMLKNLACLGNKSCRYRILLEQAGDEDLRDIWYSEGEANELLDIRSAVRFLQRQVHSLLTTSSLTLRQPLHIQGKLRQCVFRDIDVTISVLDSLKTLRFHSDGTPIPLLVMSNRELHEKIYIRELTARRCARDLRILFDEMPFRRRRYATMIQENLRIFCTETRCAVSERAEVARLLQTRGYSPWFDGRDQVFLESRWWIDEDGTRFNALREKMSRSVDIHARTRAEPLLGSIPFSTRELAISLSVSPNSDHLNGFSGVSLDESTPPNYDSHNHM